RLGGDLSGDIDVEYLPRHHVTAQGSSRDIQLADTRVQRNLNVTPKPTNVVVLIRPARIYPLHAVAPEKVVDDSLLQPVAIELRQPHHKRIEPLLQHPLLPKAVDSVGRQPRLGKGRGFIWGAAGRIDANSRDEHELPDPRLTDQVEKGIDLRAIILRVRIDSMRIRSIACRDNEIERLASKLRDVRGVVENVKLARVADVRADKSRITNECRGHELRLTIAVTPSLAVAQPPHQSTRRCVP